MNGVNVGHVADLGQVALARQRQHLGDHGLIQAVVLQHAAQGRDQAWIERQRLATLMLADQLLQHLHGQLLAGLPAIKPITVVLHEEHQLVAAIGEAQLDRRAEAAQQTKAAAARRY